MLRPSLALLTFAFSGCQLLTDADLDRLAPPDGDGDADADADGDTDVDADLDADGDADADPGDDPFARGHVVEVDITISAADWQTLVGQQRTLDDVLAGDCLSGPLAEPFPMLDATVVVDGARTEHAGMRSTGLTGTLWRARPPLELDLGGTTMFLSDATADPTGLRQCLAYDLFTDAGLPAPRCNFAHVVIDGIDAGLYVHVEDVGAALLSEGGGDLFQGAMSDFRPGWTDTFADRTEGHAGDRGPLDALAEALQASDRELEDALAPHLDVDRFLTYWAMEVLIAHWGGYAGNSNDFFAAVRPDGRVELVPWNPELAFGDDLPATPVVATSLLPRRLYQAAPERYVARVEELLDTVWDEDRIVADIDEMEDLVAPYALPGHGAAVDALRRFVRGRRSAMLDSLSPTPAWDVPLRDAPCTTDLGRVGGTLETRWGTMDDAAPLDTGSGTLEATVGDSALDVVSVGGAAGPDPNDHSRAAFDVVAVLDDGDLAVAWFSLDPRQVVAGADITLALGGNVGALLRMDPLTGAWSTIGILSDGVLHLEEADLADGATIRASFESDLVDVPWL